MFQILPTNFDTNAEVLLLLVHTVNSNCLDNGCTIASENQITPQIVLVLTLDNICNGSKSSDFADEKDTITVSNLKVYFRNFSLTQSEAKMTSQYQNVKL